MTVTDFMMLIYAKLCLSIILSAGIILNTVTRNFHWALFQCTVPALDNSFRITGPRLMLPPKQTSMFLKNSRLFRRRKRPKSFVTCHFQFFWIVSYFKVTTFYVVT